MKKLVTIREALADPALLGDAMPGPSWFDWRTLLTAVVGEALETDEERESFKRLTGREYVAAAMVGVMVLTLLVVAGRRSGKTKAMAVLSVFLACLCDWADVLSLGERGLALFLAPSERQAAIAYRYAAAIIENSPLLASLVQGRTDTVLTLSRGVDLEVMAASWRRSRGGTAIAIVLDEFAFFMSDDDSANRDTELVTALRPSLATTGGPMLLTSSPGGMEGVLFQMHKRHFGPQGDVRTLVVQSDSRGLNPTLSEAVVARAYGDDPDAAAAEYGGTFRQPAAPAFARPLVEKAVEAGVTARTVLPGVQYLAHVDVAGGSGADSWALAIGHKQRDAGRDIAVLDALLEIPPPFDPDQATARSAELLRLWRVRELTGDRYAADWPVSAFARHGVSYVHAAEDTSGIYLHAVPAFTAGRVRLLDHPRLVDQLSALRRRVGQGGRESVVHPRMGHDDLATAVAGLIWRLTPAWANVGIVAPILVSVPRTAFGDNGPYTAGTTNPTLGDGRGVGGWDGMVAGIVAARTRQ